MNHLTLPAFEALPVDEQMALERAIQHIVYEIYWNQPEQLEKFILRALELNAPLTLDVAAIVIDMVTVEA